MKLSESAKNRMAKIDFKCVKLLNYKIKIQKGDMLFVFSDSDKTPG